MIAQWRAMMRRRRKRNLDRSGFNAQPKRQCRIK
jgi:hypothetical protein